MAAQIIRMLVYGGSIICLLTGAYILYLTKFRPRTFRKPQLARRQGLITLLVGAVLLTAILIFRI